jgi:hypothetical protein
MSVHIMSTSGKSAGYNKTAQLLVPANSLELDISDIPKNIEFVDALVVTDATPGIGLTYGLSLDNHFAYTVDGWPGTPAQIERVGILVDYPAGYLGDFGTDSGFSVGNLPNTGLSYGQFEVIAQPIAGFPRGTTSTITFQVPRDESEIVIVSYDPAVGFNGVVTIPGEETITLSGQPLVVVVRIRDSHGNPAYPYSFGGKTETININTYTEIAPEILTITDTPAILSMDTGALNTVYDFRRIFLPSDYQALLN